MKKLFTIEQIRAAFDAGVKYGEYAVVSSETRYGPAFSEDTAFEKFFEELNKNVNS